MAVSSAAHLYVYWRPYVSKRCW